jgi:hypothetical protein
VEARAEELKAAAQGHEARAAEAGAELAKANAMLERLSVSSCAGMNEFLVSLWSGSTDKPGRPGWGSAFALPNERLPDLTWGHVAGT